MSELVKITNIEIDSKIYPRNTPDNAKIEEYRERMEDGEQFPPIIINRRTMHLIDGYHRYRATRALGKSEILADFIDIPEEHEWIEAIRYNARHGIPLRRSEIKEMFEKYFIIVQGKVDTEELAKSFGVSRSTIYAWIKEFEEKHGIEREKQTHKLTDEEREEIIKMHESGKYSKKEIAEKFNISPDSIKKIVRRGGKLQNRNFPPEMVKNTEKVDIDILSELDDDEGVFTSDYRKAGKAFDKILKKFLDAIADDAIRMYGKYMHEQIPQYRLVVAEELRITIPRLHELIEILLERQR